MQVVDPGSVGRAVEAAFRVVRNSNDRLLLVSCIGSDGEMGPARSFRPPGDVLTEALEFLVFTGARAAILVADVGCPLDPRAAAVMAGDIQAEAKDLGVDLVACGFVSSAERWLFLQDARIKVRI